MRKRKKIEQVLEQVLECRRKERRLGDTQDESGKKRKPGKRSRSVKEDEEKRRSDDDGVGTEGRMKKEKEITDDDEGSESKAVHERTGTIDRQRRIKKRLGGEEERMTD